MSPSGSSDKALEGRRALGRAQPSQAGRHFQPQQLVGRQQQLHQRRAVVHFAGRSQGLHRGDHHRRVQIGERRQQHRYVPRIAMRGQIIAGPAANVGRAVADCQVGQRDRFLARVVGRDGQQALPDDRIVFARSQLGQPHKRQMRNRPATGRDDQLGRRGAPRGQLFPAQGANCSEQRADLREDFFINQRRNRMRPFGAKFLDHGDNRWPGGGQRGHGPLPRAGRQLRIAKRRECSPHLGRRSSNVRGCRCLGGHGETVAATGPKAVLHWARSSATRWARMSASLS